MGMVSRDWCCLNERCRAAFHSFDDAPECPQCGNVRVHWIPGGGHIGKVAPGHDRRLNHLANAYGMTDINSSSHSRLNRAMPRAVHPGPESLRGQHTFAPGFTANIYHTASCEPSLTRNNFKGVTAAIGDSAPGFSRSRSIATPGMNPDFVTVRARHRGAIK